MSLEVPDLKCTVTAFLPIVVISLLLPVLASAQGNDVAPPEDARTEPQAGISATGSGASQDQLLAQLAQSQSRDEARRIDRELRAIWGKSGSAAMDLLLQRGRDAMENDDPIAAIEHLTALTDHAPQFAEGWHLRASAYFELELYGPALADLERALALNPSQYDAIYGLGAILEVFGDRARAHEAYRRAQAIHPHHDEIGKALDRLGPEIEGKSL